MLEIFRKLGKLVMGSSASFWTFLVVITMLGIATYLELEAKLLFGHVSTEFSFLSRIYTHFPTGTLRFSLSKLSLSTIQGMLLDQASSPQ